MEGKLIKLGLSEGYRLDDLNGNYIASTLNGKNKLSLKNCEAIVNGYDLDELACNEIGIDISVVNHIDKKMIENSSPTTPIHESGALGANLYHQVKGFEIGFQKALELLGDKKFSEKQMYEFADYSWKYSPRTHPEYDENLIKQKTEWDCIVEMEENCPYDYTSRCTQGRCDCKKPKLDAGGCLILKRK